VGREEAERMGLLGRPHHATGPDHRTFVRAGTVEDPLTAEALARALQASGISVFARPGRGGAVDVLTTGNLLGWWELLVPEEELPRAVQLLAYERSRFEGSAEEAVRAAEEEELESEGLLPPAPASAPPGHF
jgi:hypothetical protein